MFVDCCAGVCFVFVYSVCLFLQIHDDRDIDIPMSVNQQRLPVKLNICNQEVN